MMEVNFRAPLPVRESRWEKRRRVMRERRQATAFMKFRMDVIAETYSVHMKDMFLTVASKEFLKNCGKELKQMRTEQSQSQQLSATGEQFLQVDSHGSFEDVAKDSRKKKAPHRTTNLASWRVFRHHFDKYGHQPAPTGYRRVSFIRPVCKEGEMCPYKEYLHMISDMMVRTKTAQEKMKGRTRAGSLLLLSPFEQHKLEAEIKTNLLQSLPNTSHGIRRMDVLAVKRVADKLTEKKLKEQEQTGKKVLFKGKGLPEPPKSTTSGSGRKTSQVRKRSSQAATVNPGSEGQTEKGLTADSENETVASPEPRAQSPETETAQSEGEGEAPSVSSPQP